MQQILIKSVIFKNKFIQLLLYDKIKTLNAIGIRSVNELRTCWQYISNCLPTYFCDKFIIIITCLGCNIKSNLMTGNWYQYKNFYKCNSDHKGPHWKCICPWWIKKQINENVVIIILKKRKSQNKWHTRTNRIIYQNHHKVYGAAETFLF